MLLLFRFVLIVIAGRFRPRIGPLDESVVHFTVLPTDCDLNFHLNGGRFISFTDIARVELLARMRILSKMIRIGWRPIMGGVLVRFRREILPFERFTIRTRVAGWDERWFYIEHIIEKNGEFCAVAHARTVIRRKGGNVSAAELFALGGETVIASPELPPVITLWREAENAR